MQEIKEILKEIVPYAKDLISVIGNGEDVSEEYFKDVARAIEKFRYQYLSYMKDIDVIEERPLELATVDAKYYSKYIDGYLYIYIPEVMPFIKGLEYWTNDRIKTNLARVCEQYMNTFTDKVCIYVKVYSSSKKSDIDNRTIKPISDGLINAGVIQDDNMEKMMYIAEGVYSEENYTEVYVIDYKIIAKTLKTVFDTS